MQTLWQRQQLLWKKMYTKVIRMPAAKEVALLKRTNPFAMIPIRMMFSGWQPVHKNQRQKQKGALSGIGRIVQ